MEEAVAADSVRAGVRGSVALKVLIALLDLAVDDARAAAGDEACQNERPT